MDMGLGKTVSTLTAEQQLKANLDIDRTLVVAPKRVARKTWHDEIEKWDHLDQSIVWADGRGQKALDAIAMDTQIMTIGRDNFWWLVSQFIGTTPSGKLKIIREWPWDNIILDESSSFKNRNSQRWRAFYRLIIRHFVHRVVELTGSPAPNGLIDVWAPIYLLDQGERLGTSLTAYRNRWFDPPSYDHPYTYKAKDHAQGEIEGLIKDLVITMDADDYLDLPPVMDNYINVQLAPGEWDQYQKLQKKYVLDIDGTLIQAVNNGVLQQKLQQLANGAVYDDQKAVHEIHQAKLHALWELLEASEGKPLMVFYAFQHDMWRITEFLKKKKFKGWRVLDTEQDEDDWNAGKIPLLLLHPASAGHGLNLQDGGELLVWFGMQWNLEFYEQAIARLAGGHRRIGKNVINHHIVVPGTVDDDVIWALQDKANMQQRLKDAMKDRITSLR